MKIDLSAEQWTYLFSGLQSTGKTAAEWEASLDAVWRKVTIVYKDGANIRRQPAIGNNIVRLARNGETFKTNHEETVDNYGNKWIEIPEGFVSTRYNNVQRCNIEVLP